MGVCGVITAAIASHKGRSPVGWFFVGFLVALIGVIIACCMSNLKQEQAQQQYMQMEQRRLREQLRQEQLRLESLRQYANARIDAHDQLLGVNTRPAAALPGMAPTLAALQGATTTGDPAGDAMAALTDGQPGADRSAAGRVLPAPGVQADEPATWYYECEGTAFGPVPASAIHMLLSSRRLTASTLLWCQDLTEWTPASAINVFQSSVQA
jgi:hypothetical protein